MTISEELRKAEKLLNKCDYTEALCILKALLKEHPQSHRALLMMTQCLMRNKSYDLAYDSSEELVANAFELGKSQNIYEACKVKAMYHYRMKEYEEAFKWIVVALKYDSGGDNEGPIFKDMVTRNLCKKGGLSETEIKDKEKEILSCWKEPSAIGKATEGDNPDAKIVPLQPTKVSTKEKETIAEEPEKVVATSHITTPKKQPMRHDWYDSAKDITLSIYIKKIDSSSVLSELKPDSITVKFNDSNGCSYEWSTALAHEIDVEKSSYRVYGTKLEYLLSKADDSIHWQALTGDEVAADLEPEIPSFSKKIDWSELGEGTEDVEDDDADAFFKKLYAGADENTRRAMMKSFTESNGTSLSMNWDEVGEKQWLPYEDKEENDQ